MTINLCTLSQVRSMLHFESADTGDDSLISDVLIPAASDMIQNQVQYTFGTLSGASLYLDAFHPYLKGDTLYFRDNVVTQVDRFTSDTGTLTAGVDFDLLPLNFNPKTRARLRSGASWQVNVPQKAFTIYGTLGYGSIPSDVNFAATKLAAWMYQTRDSEGNIQVVENVVEVPANAPPLVLTIVRKYEHALIFA